MQSTHHVSLSAALAATALAVLPVVGSAQDPSPADQHFKIENRSAETVTVRVLHSDGSLQKQETIKPGDGHRFTFSWCWSCCGYDKRRKFEVKTGSVVRATGHLYMSTNPGPEGTLKCHEENQITVTDEDESDGLTFSTSYENDHRNAILKVYGDVAPE